MASRQAKSGHEGLARLLSERREALGLSRRDLADRTGLSYPYISQLETAYRLPSSKVMHVLARALGVPASDLFQALPNDEWEAQAVDFPAGAPPAPASPPPASQWIANPGYSEPARQPPLAAIDEAARSAIRALEALPEDRRLDALAIVQAAVLAGVVRDRTTEEPD